jgi:ABC-2 type transport system ATP-binding protein
MIETLELCKTYAKGRIIANDRISLRIESSKIYSLLGPNGAGKTTLIKILATLVLPTSGTARVSGYDILKQGNDVRKAIGLSTGRERSFYYRLTGRQNLEFFGALRGLKGKDLRSRTKQLLNVLDLWEHKDRKYMKYSSGMKKKLSLARALLTDPPVLLLDEPTSGIDPVSTRDIRGMIRSLRDSGKSVLVATHDMHEAEELSDRIGILKAGKLLKEDTPENLRSAFQAAIIVVKLAGNLAPRDVVELQHLQSVEKVNIENSTLRIHCLRPHDIINEVVRVVQAQTPLTDVRITKPSLQDVFIGLTKERASD